LTPRPTDNVHPPTSVCNAPPRFLSAAPFRRLRQNLKANEYHTFAFRCRADTASASQDGTPIAFYRWHPQRPFYVLCFAILEPKEHQGRSLTGRLYCTPKALWKLRSFLRDFGYDPDLMGRDEVDEKALLGLRGIVRISRTTLNGRTFLNLGGFAPCGAQKFHPAPI
jgi:hypothetical protein